MNRSTKFILIAVAVLSVLIADSFFGQDSDIEYGIRLPVEHAQDDGGVRYKPVWLKSATISFFERKREIRCDSKIMDYTLNRDDDGHLNYFHLILRAEPVRWKPVPPEAQSAPPLTKWTNYWDLDGDSVFDAMCKIGPDLHETYIIIENQWTRVANSRAKWGAKPTAQDFHDRQVKYSFEGGFWKR